ncbi:DEAD-box ATP-dependent RNA helicase 14-like [Wolffia australiana]
MMASAAAGSTSVRYAPEDPTLPKPWKGLIDGNTGYLYFWNPVTNITQYERPVPLDAPSLPPPPPNPPKPVVLTPNSVIQGKQTVAAMHGHQRDMKEDDGRHGGARGYGQHGSKTTTYCQSYTNGSVSIGHGTSSVHISKSSLRGHDSAEIGAALSVESYRRQHEITAMGDDIPAPYMTFESTGFPSEVLQEVQHAGFSFPTPIQAQSWPIALQGHDIVAIAKTGSGKTLGYLFPAFIHLKKVRNNSRMGPTVLILAPTRELATQIQEEAVKFGRSSRVSCTCLYGGAPKGPQLRDIERGADVVVATPGRLNDILEMRRISLRQVSYLVLDEADRMLDMGFEPQIRKIVKEIPTRRQTLMFTATWPKEVRKIAADLLDRPLQVNIGNIDELVANAAITQYVEVMSSMEKQRRLEQILRSQEPGSKMIVFCSTKRMCDQLSRLLARTFGAAAIHGDKSQSERDFVLNQFRSGRAPILVATDVAARGLDIKDIRVVINYDFPTGVEDYVHRIGRTGRAGATGLAYTFFCDQDAKYAGDLIKVLEGASQRVPSELRALATRGGYGKARSRWAPTSGGPARPHAGGLARGPTWASSATATAGRSDRDRDLHHHRDRYDRGYYEEPRKGGRSRSRSRSPARGGHGRGRSRSPSRGRVHSARRSRSHTRSRSRSRSHERYEPAHVSARGSPSRSAERGSGSPYGGGGRREEKGGSPRKGNSPVPRFAADEEDAGVAGPVANEVEAAPQ